MKKVGIHRREFLRGAGRAALALPFLPSLLPRSLGAQEITQPKRFIAIKSYSTQIIKDWYPVGVGGGYTLKDQHYSGHKADGTTLLHDNIPGTPYTWAPLRDFGAIRPTDPDLSGPSVSRIIGPELNPYLDKMLLLRGLDFLPSCNHNDGGMLGNYAGGSIDTAGAATLPEVPTIDQIMAFSQSFFGGAATPRRSLHLAPGGENSCSYTHNGVLGSRVTQVPAHLNPLTAFREVFGDAVSKPTSGDNSPQAGNVALVNRLYHDYRRASTGPRLGSEDRQLLERHMTFLSELEKNLSALGSQTGDCRTPKEPGSFPNSPPFANLDRVADIKQSYELMIDVLVAAIMCDRTRIVTLDVRKALSDGRGSMAGYYHGRDDPGSWHGDAHSWGDPSADRNMLQLNRWIAKDIFAKLLERLDVPEAQGRTFLDNSVVYWGNEVGFNHINLSVPALLAGSAGGFLRTGRYVDYIDWNGKAYFGQNGGTVIKGIAHNRLLVTLLRSMGLSANDYESQGKPGYGSDSTIGKSASSWPTDYSHLGDMLPGIVA